MFVNLDLKNDCGNYWSSPKHYFEEFKKYPSIGLDDLNDITDIRVLIFGGGSVSKIKTVNKINQFQIKNKKIKFISWGLGFNYFDYTKSRAVVPNIKNSKVINKNYFKDFYLQGLRDYEIGFNYEWTPCASCLHPFFQKYRKINSHKKIGVYYDANMIFKIQGIDEEDYMFNLGLNLEDKLSFLSKYEFIITNSYYGVYWAQLLNKKVICLPVKQSLLNFKYQPFFLKGEYFKYNKEKDSIKIEKNVFENCLSNEDFLEESIAANYEFKKKINKILDFV